MNRKSPHGLAALTCLKVAASLLFLTGTLLAADPVVSNVQGLQRPGTKLVDISYDVTADTPTVSITLRISSDGGTTFTVPATTLTGAVGANVPVGTGKVITWNAGTDWLGNYSTAMRFEVKVDDGVVPAPEGFAYVAAGALPDSSWAGAQAVDGFFMAKTEVTWSEFQTEWLRHRERGSRHGTEPAGHCCQLVSSAKVVQCPQREGRLEPGLQGGHGGLSNW
jgi:hypothetical protein